MADSKSEVKAPATENAFIIAGAREKLTKERTIELLQPLKDAIDAKDFGRYQRIKLSNKSFGEDSAQYLQSLLLQLTGITAADCSDIIAGRMEQEALVVLKLVGDALAEQPLRELNMSDNALGQKGINAIHKALINKPNLTKLYFNNDGLQGDAATDLTRFYLSNFPEDQPSPLTHFECFNNLLQDAGAKAFSPLFLRSPHLEHVRFATTRLSAAGGQALISSLVNARVLRHLDVSDNTLSDEGIELLTSQILAEQPHLRTLSLADNGFSTEQVASLLTALKKTAPQLTALDLTRADIDAETASSTLSDFVRSKPHLTSLVLDANNICSSGARDLARALSGHQELTSLSLADAEIGKGAVSAIKRYLLSNKPSLVRLVLNGNVLLEGDVEALQAAAPASLNLEVEDQSEPMEEEEDVAEEEEAAAAAEVDELAEGLAKQSL